MSSAQKGKENEMRRQKGNLKGIMVLAQLATYAISAGFSSPGKSSFTVLFSFYTIISRLKAYVKGLFPFQQKNLHSEWLLSILLPTYMLECTNLEAQEYCVVCCKFHVNP